LPEELRRREDRLAAIQAAKQRLQEQARAEAEAEGRDSPPAPLPPLMGKGLRQL